MDKINSTNIIPTIIINTLKNININFTPDLPNKNGGLSYTTKYTNELNIKFIKDYYKNIMNYDISDDDSEKIGEVIIDFSSIGRYSLKVGSEVIDITAKIDLEKIWKC